MPIVWYVVASLLLGAVAAFSAENPADAPAQTTDPKDLELIHTILKHNQAAVDEVKSLRLKETWEATSVVTSQETPDDPPPGEKRISCQVDYIAKGKWFKGDSKVIKEVKGTTYRKESRIQALLNGTSYTNLYTAEKEDPSEYAITVDRTEYSTLADMPADRREDAESKRPQLPLGFVSAGRYHFPQRLNDAGSVWNIKREDVGGVVRYVITCKYADGGYANYEFDPQRNFYLVAIDYVEKSGARNYTLRVTLGDMGGEWFPIRVEEFLAENSVHLSLHVEKAETNIEIPDSEFDFESLEFDRARAMMSLRRASSAEKVKLVFREGKWVPKELVDTQKLVER